MTDAYLAGLFDGEGCVGIVKRRTGNGLWYAVEVSVAMTHEETVRGIQDAMGLGGVSFKRRQNRHWKDCFKWSASSKSAIEFLRRIAPHVVTKRQQISLALEADEARRNKTMRGRFTSTETLQSLENYKQRISDLNRKGTR